MPVLRCAHTLKQLGYLLLTCAPSLRSGFRRHQQEKNNDNKKEEPLDLNIDKGETIKVASKKDSKSKSKIFKSIVIDISDDDE